MDWTYLEETCYEHHPAVPRVEPASRGQEEGQIQKVMAKDSTERVREHWVVVGGGETDGTKSSPMEICSGGPMLRSDRRGLSQSVSQTDRDTVLSKTFKRRKVAIAGTDPLIFGTTERIKVT